VIGEYRSENERPKPKATTLKKTSILARNTF
jgi:hypothetical protein